MSDNHINGGGYASPSKAERLEHAEISGVHGKKVFVVDSNGNQIDGATLAKQDEIIAKLPLNEVGRLKTSNLPADIAPVTGTITANGQTIPVPTDRVSNVMAHCFGTFSTVNVTFEGSINSTNGVDGNWFTIQAVRTNANTIETASGNLSAAPAYGWELSVNALKYMRVRATAFTSGTQNWVFSLGSYATEPIPAIQLTGTQPISLAAAATAIAKAEDSASASTNVGVPPLSVRADTLPADAGVSANGDYAFIFCDTRGRVYTTSVSIDYAHNEIHDGNHFFYSDCVELGSGGVQDYLITTGAKFSHLSFDVDGSAITAIDIFEASDKTGTTLQTIFNNNRTSTTTSANTIHKAVSGGTTDGTKIWCHKGGAATGASVSAGASSKQDSEIILKTSTKYIIRITSSTAGNLTNLKLNWYEK